MSNNFLNVQSNGNARITVVVGETGATPDNTGNGESLAKDFALTNTASVPHDTAETTRGRV
ncbi:hypothetical protein PQX77_018926, partial [Marasmius sp. AFHP31]